MAVIGGSTVSAKAKVIKSYNEDALEKTIYQSVTQKEKSPIGVEPTDLLLLVQMLYY